MSPPFHPVAIVGIGCRFPGGCDDPESYWRLLCDGRDAIGDIPEGRWNSERFYSAGQSRRGKTNSIRGGFVQDIEAFDPDLFGISPREAAAMDPQQRMLLEVTYRAFEDAGIPAGQVAGQPVSVHVGISSFDYAVAALSFRDRGVLGPYSNTGGSSSIAANRISYCFDLRGESVAVDTACSSSLIATHLAFNSLQDPQTKMALAGGVNAILLPDFSVAFSQLGVLSPDGRCKTFDASADGYVRSEGAGMVVLKRLKDAVADGDSIYAVIVSSASNQDGRTEGMTVPSESAQRSLIQTAVESARLEPEQVTYVEAHGTGTPVGDPIEARAITSSYGAPDRRRDCLVGSVKTNIGHLEAGAGIASLIKVALAIRHGQIPAHRNLETLHPEIDFASFGCRVPKATEDWDHEGRRFAAINGFGYGGANAHLILGNHVQEPTGEAPAGTKLMTVSAPTRASLEKTAEAFADYLEDSDAGLESLAAAAARHRTHHRYRVAIGGDSKADWMTALRQVAESSVSAKQADIVPDSALAFVFGGQGPQWWAMGRDLYADSSHYRDTIDACDREFSRYVDWSLLAELNRGSRDSRLGETAIAQPSLFALQVGVASHWRSWGIEPSTVVGHSVGEIAAAYVSGSLTFEDACRVAIERGRTMDLASSKGAMIAVGLSEVETTRRIAEAGLPLSIAAVNSSGSVTVSGDAAAIEILQASIEAEGLFCKRLNVEYAFHSSQMDPVREPLLDALSGLSVSPSKIPMISTVTGDVIDGQALDAEYWWNNVRQTVRFADAMRRLSRGDTSIVIEVAPHPVLTYSISECFQDAGREVACLPSLHREQADRSCLRDSLGRLYELGFSIDWSKVFPNRSSVKLPPLVMDKRSLWSESYESQRTRMASGYQPLLGQSVDTAVDTWEERLDLQAYPDLEDHRVRNACVLPAAALIGTAVAAVRSGDEPPEAFSLRQFVLDGACLLDAEPAVRIQTSYDRRRRRLRVSSSSADATEWASVASCVVSSVHQTKGPRRSLQSELLDGATSQEVTPERLYEHCKTLGLNYGAKFRTVAHALRRPGEALVRVEATCDEDCRYELAPALLDGCFHGMILADPEFESDTALYLPQSIAAVDFFKPVSETARAHVRLVARDERRIIADLNVFDETGEHCIAIRGFESVRVGAESTGLVDELIYHYQWQPAEKTTAEVAAETNRKWLVFADQGGVSTSLAQQIPDDQAVVTVQHGTSFKRLSDHSFLIDPECGEDFHRLLNDVGDGIRQLVYLWGLDAPDNEELSEEVLRKTASLTTTAPMHLVQAWESAHESGSQSHTADLAIVTRGAQPNDSGTALISMAPSPLIGFGRVVINECGSLSTKLVDLDHDDTAPAVTLFRELVDHRDAEDEIRYAESIRWVRRFVKATEQPLPSESQHRERFRLEVGQSALIDQLRYRSQRAMPLASHEIEIEVLATGLNFSDVMKSLDLYPGLPAGPVLLGAECSGRVNRVGAGVDAWCVGDEVVAIAPGAFGSHVTVDADLVAKKPAKLTHAEAASLPIAFLTADYALNQCARVRSGETVLIHSASGGVGLAALQLARQAGARVLATAGTEHKRNVAREAGAERVADSRSLSFVRDCLDATDGAGVDVILNSLAGEAIPQGLSLLALGGRFLEIGKRDIYADAEVGLLPFKNNLALFAIDLDQLFRERPRQMGKMLRKLMERFEAGELQPTVVTRYTADETAGAFELMRNSDHVGKVVVDMGRGVEQVWAGKREPIEIHPEGTYWLAGGLGGFGLAVAQWLVDCGAKHLVLGGRSPKLTAADEPIRAWTDSGVDVQIVAVDLCSIESVDAAVAEIEQRCPPLAGVFHTAMILDDCLLRDLDHDRLDRVLGPKVLGGWNLHQATMDCDLQWFVLFSSLSSVFGHAGQANYSAANAFLDSLAHYRRTLGMNATVINWGHLAEVGYLSRRTELAERLRRQGVLSFNADEAMLALEHAFRRGVIQQSVLRMDWTVWRGLGVTRSDVSPRFAHLLREPRESKLDLGSTDLAGKLRSCPPEEQRGIVEQLVIDKMAALLGTTAENIDRDRPLLSMGLDSLMAVEMRNHLEGRLEIALPIAELMRSDSVRDLCEAIHGRVATGTAEVDVQELDDVAREVSEMSDQRVDELLAELLKQQESGQTGG